MSSKQNSRHALRTGARYSDNKAGPARRSLGEGGSPRNLFAITQELTGEILRRVAGKPNDCVRAFLH